MVGMIQQISPRVENLASRPGPMADAVPRDGGENVDVGSGEPSRATAAGQLPERIVSRWFGAFNLRDLDKLLTLLDRRVDFHPLKLRGLVGSYRGHAGVREWWSNLERHRVEHHIELSDVRSIGGGMVLALGSLRFVGELESASFRALHRVNAGLIVAAHHCLSDPAMIEHLGLIP